MFVFDVNKNNFNESVFLNSHEIPVIVEFMGGWSGPCVAMENLFTGLSKEFSEKFVFAKVDIDAQTELKDEYKIVNIPTILVFKDGKLLRTEVGELKEQEARNLLNDLGVFHESDKMREQAREKHLAGDTPAAILQLTEAIKSAPSNTRVVMDMVQIFIDIGELEQANGLYVRLPQSVQETEMGKALNGQITFANLADKTDSMEVLQSKISADENDHDARFDLSIRKIEIYQYSEAVDELVYILEKMPEYKNGAAKEMLVTVANMIAPINIDLAQDIRRRLTNLLAN